MILLLSWSLNINIQESRELMEVSQDWQKEGVREADS